MRFFAQKFFSVYFLKKKGEKKNFENFEIFTNRIRASFRQRKIIFNKD